MPFDPKQSLESLKALSQLQKQPTTPYQSDDPATQRYFLQQQRESELEDRADATLMAGPTIAHTGPDRSYGANDPIQQDVFNKQYVSQLAGLKSIGGHLSHDIAENPITQGIQANRDIDQANYKAIGAGFGGDPNSPLARAGNYQRGLETAKVNAPVEAARVNSSGDVERQRVANQGALDVANTRADQYGEMMNLLSSGRAGNIRSMSMPGGGGVSFAPEPATNSRLLSDITKARATYEAARSKYSNSWFGSKHALEAPKAALQQSIDNQMSAISQHEQYDPMVQKFARNILLDDNAHNLSLDEILQNSSSAQSLPPEHLDALQRLLSRLRGF